MKFDLLGILLTSACAVHCVALPAFVTLMPLYNLEWLHNELLEFGLLGFGLVVAAYTLGKDYRAHRNSNPALIWLAGFVLLLVNHFVPGFTFLALIGGAATVASFLLNNRYHRAVCKGH